jgi:hypothetical protein
MHGAKCQENSQPFKAGFRVMSDLSPEMGRKRILPSLAGLVVGGAPATQR